jgi:hypothetical protein
MPSMSMPLNPATLGAMRPAPPTASTPSPSATPSGPGIPPGLMQGLASRPGGMPSPNPYQGNQNPGDFVTPAPFNPILALTLLSQAGMLPSAGSAAGRGPVGGFGVGGGNPGLNPRQKNPYTGGFPTR